MSLKGASAAYRRGASIVDQRAALGEALEVAYAALLVLADADAGPVGFWDGDGEGNTACTMAYAALVPYRQRRDRQ